MFLFYLCVIFLFGILGVNIQSSTEQWKTVSVVDLSKFVPEPNAWPGYKLSPDTRMVAWLNDMELCLLRIENSKISCHPAPELMETLAWSPNNQYVLLTSWFRPSSSLYIYELTTEHFEHYEIDDYFSSYGLWNSTGTKLYILSDNYRPDDQHKTLVHEYDLSTGKHKVRDVSKLMQNDFKQNKLIRVSADGDQIVVETTEANKVLQSIGIWQIDLAGQTSSQIATLNDLTIGLPDWYSKEDGQIEDIVWKRKTDQLIVAIGAGLPTRTLTVTRFDSKTQSFIPLLDYRQIPKPAEQSSYNLEHGGGQVTADGEFLFYYEFKENSPDRAIIYAIHLSDDPKAFFVMDAYHINCDARWLLITLQREQKVRRYIYPFFVFCPG